MSILLRHALIVAGLWGKITPSNGCVDMSDLYGQSNRCSFPTMRSCGGLSQVRLKNRQMSGLSFPVRTGTKTSFTLWVYETNMLIKWVILLWSNLFFKRMKTMFFFNDDRAIFKIVGVSWQDNYNFINLLHDTELFYVIRISYWDSVETRLL